MPALNATTQWVKLVALTKEQHPLQSQFTFCEPKLHLTDVEAFKVVGVLGRQEVGKSFVMSYLSGHTETDKLPSMPSTALPTALPPTHSSGVDLAISPEHLLFLDSQALFGPHHLSYLMSDDSPFPVGVTSYEDLLNIQSLQIAAFVLSVCHIVVVVQDVMPDIKLWQWLSAADMLRSCIPDMSSITAGTSSATADSLAHAFSPKIVFVFNKAAECDCSRAEHLSETLSTFFEGSQFARHTNKRGESGGVLPVHTIPRAGAQCFQSHVEALVYSVLSTSVVPFARPLSQREWARNAARIWELVHRTLPVAEYNKILNKISV
eukprot:TRINITY_DN4421_c0_g1_i1.p2 TRINITY_DN4421_c0_g1~~TRINITY_DN4421_c0_g1_i1.p2  ORF type:complete len:342 (+),score=80.75 TRINITY_DN4421_c0_g1_i1:66-1028(+)